MGRILKSQLSADTTWNPDPEPMFRLTHADYSRGAEAQANIAAYERDFDAVQAQANRFFAHAEPKSIHSKAAPPKIRFEQPRKRSPNRPKDDESHPSYVHARGNPLPTQLIRVDPPLSRRDLARNGKTILQRTR
jgi:hypothetical protein